MTPLRRRSVRFTDAVPIPLSPPRDMSTPAPVMVPTTVRPLWITDVESVVKRHMGRLFAALEACILTRLMGHGGGSRGGGGMDQVGPQRDTVPSSDGRRDGPAPLRRRSSPPPPTLPRPAVAGGTASSQPGRTWEEKKKRRKKKKNPATPRAAMTRAVPARAPATVGVDPPRSEVQEKWTEVVGHEKRRQ